MSESRVKERERVFQLLFSAEFHPTSSAEEILSCALESEETDAFSEYVTGTFCGALEFASEAMELATKHARGWSDKRMSPAMRALLKLSLYEILKSDIPVKIAANEAVELCKHYEDERGAKFLNGLLGTVSRMHAPEKCQD